MRSRSHERPFSHVRQRPRLCVANRSSSCPRGSRSGALASLGERRHPWHRREDGAAR